MRYFQLLLLRGALIGAVLACATAGRGADPATATVWHELGDRIPIEGAGWGDAGRRFDRLPAKAETIVRPEVWNLSRDSAGLQFRFITDADVLRVRWKLRRSDRLAMTHMAATGVSGLDLYVRDAGRWRWLAVARPESAGQNERTLVAGLKREPREYLLYLPLYNGIESISLGLPPGVTLSRAPDRYAGRKPVVFYGTSITQGGCATRPGMVYTALLGRALDWPVVNLGFSGNGKCEPEMAQLLTELDPAAYVIDPLGNLEVAQAAERLEPFIVTLRRRHPTTPIVLVEGVTYADTAFLDARRVLVTERNVILRRLYDRLKAAGDRHLHFIAASALLGGDGEDTVDGTHPTDLGFLRMAEGMEPVIRDALVTAGAKFPAEAVFTPLFDGRTLGDWTTHDGMPAIHSGSKWWVEDGAMAGTQDPPGKGGILWLERPFTDFILKFQMKLTHPMDTGVFLRMGPTGLSHQVCIDYRPGSDVGAIFIPFVGHKYVSRFSDGARLVNQESWNDFAIRIEGEPARIRVWMNSRLLTDFQHTEVTARGLPPSGGIGFQVHPDVENIQAWGRGNTVRIRNIAIQELPRS